MRLAVETFMGEIPRLNPRLLPDGYAQTAISARLENGDLYPMRQQETIVNLAGVADTIYRDAATWLGFTGDTDVVPGPTAEDRLYITDGINPPRIRYSGVEYALTVPAPTTGPVIANVSSHDTNNESDVLYAYTWVTSLGEESQPSPLSNRLTTSPDVAVRIDTFEAAPAGRLVTHMRLYRSETSASGVTELFFVDELPAATATFDHDITLLPLSEAIPSNDWTPPNNLLHGLTVMPNGIIAGFVGREVYFCEPYRPHAWPSRYALTVDYPVVGLVAFGSTLVVCTEGQPYRIQGFTPETMVMEKIEQNLPCVAKRGIVDLGYAAAYPSTDGLVLIDASGGRLVSEPLFTREQWRDLNPEGFRAAQLTGRYVFSHQPAGQGARKLGFIDLSGDQPFYLTKAVQAHDLIYDLETGQLIALLSDQLTVADVDTLSPNREVYTWRSKLAEFKAPVSFGAIFVEGRFLFPTSNFLAVDIYADGALLHQIGTLNSVERLPPGEYARWEVEIRSNARITSFVLAQSVEEIFG